MQLRAFYAMQDTRTPTLINLGVNAVLILTDVTLYALLPVDVRVIGLAAGHATSFLVGLVLCSVVLSRRIGGLDGALVVRTVVRCVVAVLLPALAALGCSAVSTATLGEGPLGSAVGLATGGAVLAAGYVLIARRMRVGEIDEVAGPVLRRIGLR